MSNRDTRIDDYISNAGAFAQPILIHIRELIHITIPEIQETIKWGMPSFDYKGALCNFASFKAHCSFGFWKPTLINDPTGLLQNNAANGGEAMGNMGRLTSIQDLPSDAIFMDWLLQAKRLNDQGISIKKGPRKETPNLSLPECMISAFSENNKAKVQFEGFSQACQNEYIIWISEAKREETKMKRLEIALVDIELGRKRNWQYQK